MSRNVAYDAELEHLRGMIENKENLIGFGDVDKEEICGIARGIVQRIHDTYVSKDNDYSENGKPMGNLRSSEEIGIPAWKGVLLRMNDKRKRVGSFVAKGSYQVADEKVDDTLIDLCNYSLLGVLLFDEAMADYDSEITMFPEVCKELRQKIDAISEEFRLLAFQTLHTRLLHLFASNYVDKWSGTSWDKAKKHFDNICEFARKSC